MTLSKADMSCLSPFEQEVFAQKPRRVVDRIDRPMVTDLFFYMFLDPNEEKLWTTETDTQENNDGPMRPSSGG